MTSKRRTPRHDRVDAVRRRLPEDPDERARVIRDGSHVGGHVRLI
jgi:hypothetical protein